MDNLAERWWQRRQTSEFRAAPAFGATGLVLGYGTRLLRFDLMAGPALDVAGHDRLLTLLAVAGKGRVSGRAADDIVFAADQWRRGDQALAAIRLAFAPLPRFAGSDDAYLLFLAEIALDAGVTPRDLLAELDYGGSVGPLLKRSVDQPRVPAGSGRTSGRRWTDGSPAPDATVVTTGRSAAVDGGPRNAPSDQHQASDVVPASLVGIPMILPRVFDQLRSRTEEDDKDGLACPVLQNDVGHGAGDPAKRFEALIARLVNPSDPTPKNTPETPNVVSASLFPAAAGDGRRSDLLQRLQTHERTVADPGY